MEAKGTKMIWCEHCRRGAWRHVNGLLWKGLITTRSGLLKVPASCHACEEELPLGSRVEAVTINVGEREADEWVRMHLGSEEALEEGTFEAEEA